MTLERKNGLFVNISDSELIGQLITNNGLSKNVSETNNIEPQLVQYYASDWDMMMTRAQVNSFVVIVDAGTVTVQEPNTSQTPDLVVKYGDSILDLNLTMNAADQYAASAINSCSWDMAQQVLTEAGPSNVKVTEPGNISSAELAKVFNVKSYTQQTGGSVGKTALQDWSSAELLRSMLAKIRGSVLFEGTSLAKTGKTIELAGLGQRFNGNAYISRVHHSITEGKWLTRVEVGMASQWFAEVTPDIAAPDAAGQLPPIKGLQTGIVKKIDQDPEGEFRVLVTMPLLQDDTQAIWVRLGNFYASNRVGAEFYPELKDEVVLGFMNDDPRYGVILGSLYSKTLPPPYPPDADNTKKTLKTKAGLEILFDDKDKIISISTPGNQSIKIDDKAKSITLTDSNSNTVILSKDGIVLQSSKDIKLDAKGNISLNASANASISAGTKASISGKQIDLNASSSLSCKGASAQVTGSTTLNLKGGMVNIN
jgi:Rhs element Vgr protein